MACGEQGSTQAPLSAAAFSEPAALLHPGDRFLKERM